MQKYCYKHSVSHVFVSMTDIRPFVDSFLLMQNAKKLRRSRTTYHSGQKELSLTFTITSFVVSSFVFTKPLAKILFRNESVEQWLISCEQKSVIFVKLGYNEQKGLVLSTPFTRWRSGWLLLVSPFHLAIRKELRCVLFPLIVADFYTESGLLIQSFPLAIPSGIYNVTPVVTVCAHVVVVGCKVDSKYCLKFTCSVCTERKSNVFGLSFSC